MKHLQRLFNILSLGNQNAKAAYIKQQYGKYFHQDEYGNLYLNRDFRQQKPYLVAHIDTVDEQPTAKQIIVDPYAQIISGTRHGKPCNLGADDGVGVFAALQLFDLLDIGVALFKDEEVGCIGSSHADSDYLNASYLIQLDRKGHEDLIFNGAGTIMASDDFINAVENIAQNYGYTSQLGGLTDVVTLSDQGIVEVSCMNLSCGYYKPHTKDEYIDIRHMQKAIDFTHSIINTLGNEIFPHKAIREWESDYHHKPNKNIRCFMQELLATNMTDEEIYDELYFFMNDYDWYY
ncbi:MULTISPECIES: M20/M25/M40 family metallo-hydrolase [Cysteiniphilum]|uniref:M20/M25/M40 family metallo-hydrolase n=1 Tax=Cysteiniphilum TaxID=2056696 RepID=UPI0017846259|nr:MULTISPECIES: M20/M25/M40 family metallo-hydrolase [Cysteiniphilum]